ncbi:MAG: hypothetical protein IT324_32105 [Anaerolineae bacterium]|nr:hypothetical protein [Anaerolineae bacterium]
MTRSRLIFPLILVLAFIATGVLALRPLLADPTIDTTHGDAYIFLAADRAFVWNNGCITVRWRVENNREVYLNGEGKAGSGQQPVCLSAGEQPVLWVVFKDGTSQQYRLPITVLFTAPDNVLLGTWFALIALCGLGLLRSARPDSRWRLSYLPCSRWGWIALIGFVLLSSILTYYAQNEGSGWLKMTSPVEASHRANSLLDYGTTWGVNPIHYENLSSIDQVALFSGVSAPPDLYFMRAVYTFVASLIVPLVGVFNACLLVNYLCWAAAAWITWRFTKQLWHDERAALLAVVCVTGGMGMIVHSGDYSAHLMAFTFYYLGILLVYESRVWYEQRPFTTHLALGLFLALACFQYNTGLALAIGYVAVSIWRNRWYQVLVAAAIAFSAQTIWLHFLNLLNQVINHAPTWTNFYAVEELYRKMAIDGWTNVLLRQPIGAAVGSLLRILGEFVLFDSPLVVALGALALILLPRFKHLSLPAGQGRQVTGRDMAWFLVVFIGLPVGAALVYAPSATARGYLIYGVSLLFYAALAGILAFYLRQAGIRRIVAVVVLIVVVGSHFAWNTAHLWGYFAPVKSYFLGMDDAQAILTHIPHIVSLTSHEPTPALFGGPRTLESAGLFFATPMRPILPSLPDMLLARSLFTCYIVALLWIVVRPTRWRVISAVTVIAVVVLSAVLSAATLHTIPQPSAESQGISLPAGQRLSYQVTLSDQLVDRLDKQYTDGDTLVLYLRASPDQQPQVKLRIGTRDLTITPAKFPYFWSVNARDFLDAIRQSRQMALEIVAQDGTFLTGWQTNGLPDRTMTITTPNSPRSHVLPLVEIRLMGADNRLKVAGF